jgi:hypothetical protein
MTKYDAEILTKKGIFKLIMEGSKACREEKDQAYCPYNSGQASLWWHHGFNLQVNRIQRRAGRLVKGR